MIKSIYSNTSNLDSQLNTYINSGSLKDITKTGLYYITGAVADIPGGYGHGGSYYYKSLENNGNNYTGIGLFLVLYGDNHRIYICERNDATSKEFSDIRSVGFYSISSEVIEVTTTATGAVSRSDAHLGNRHFIEAHYADSHIGLIYLRDNSYLTCVNSSFQPYSQESIVIEITYWKGT